MFTSKARLVVGLTTYYHENLGISVPALARFGGDIVLVIHNDNPDVKLSRRLVRRLGYRGALHIINTSNNVGLLGARLAILGYVRSKRINADWFMFADDDDVVLSVDVPPVSSNTFAVIQNMAVIRTRLIDVLRIMHRPDNYIVDNQNICLVRPHIGLAGTLVRLDVILRTYDVLYSVYDDLMDISHGLNFLPPIDAMMWSGVNMVARAHDADMVPIYMDNTNYIAINIDSASEKYGMPVAPIKNAKSQMSRALSRYNSVIASGLAAMQSAAPVGQESNT